MDFPRGPLDVYRQKASFSWKDMLDFLEGEDIQAFKVSSSEISRYRGGTEDFVPSSATCSEPWRTTRCSRAGPAKTCPWTG